jgi:hypothetical protein
MRTHNWWVRSNFNDVAAGRADVFNCGFYPRLFTPMPFHLAAAYTAAKIWQEFDGRKFFIGLSGGPDSEYVVELFYQLHIPFTPIIVRSGINEEDFENAMSICHDLALNPIVHTCTEQDIVDYYFRVIYPHHNEGITHVHQMLAIEKAKQLGGVIVLGESHVCDTADTTPTTPIMRAYKFLPDLISSLVIPFYYYTVELTYAEMSEVRENETAQEYKARVRGTRLRPKKVLPKYKTNQSYHEAVKALKPEWLSCNMGTSREFLEQMEKYIR